MYDDDGLRERLFGYGIKAVRQKLAAGAFGEKRLIVEQWLREQDALPTATRRAGGFDPLADYQPTAGDRKYQDAFKARDLNSFEEAVLLQGVSDAYLSVLISDNSGASSAGFKAMLDAEVTRRGHGIAKRANLIALSALGVSLIAAVIAIVAIVQG